METELSLREYLKKHFQKMKAKNSGYSLRAMACHFGTSPAQLSQVLSGKRPLSYKFASKVAQKLNLSPMEKAHFLGHLKEENSSAVEFQIIEEDQFKLVADWYHFAILSLGQLGKNSCDPRWIASRLNIDPFTVKEAYDRLKRLGLIAEKNGRFNQVTKHLHTTNDVPSEAIRKHHKQTLELAAEKIDQVDISLREYSSISIATSVTKLPLAKKMIRQFKEDLFEFLEDGEKEEIFTLAIQLFPNTKIKNKGESK